MNQSPRLRSWPARYKACTIELHETDRNQVWITSAEVRKVLTSLRADAQLERLYGTDFRRLDKSKRIFFSERALKKELQYLRSKDALMFEAWLDKTVYYPAARKRGDADSLQPMPERVLDEESEKDERDLHIPTRKLAPAPKSRHTQRKAVEIFARSSLVHDYLNKPFVSIWRGEVELGKTMLVGGLAVILWIVAVSLGVNAIANPTTYSGSYVWRQWVVLILILSLGIALAWWCVGVMRCAIRRQRAGRNFSGSLTAFVLGLTALLYLLPVPVALASEWVEGWWSTVQGELKAADVIHDKFLGRIVVRGPLGFGTYTRLEAALTQRPILTLVEIDSPGGYVVEGFAMARLIERTGADTVSLGECASACTLMLAAGNERYLGTESEVGFHRSWSRRFGYGNGWNSTDHKIADYYRSRGTSEEFVKRALDTPGYDLWMPDQGQMFSAGYVTKRWDERKAGY